MPIQSITFTAKIESLIINKRGSMLWRRHIFCLICCCSILLGACENDMAEIKRVIEEEELKVEQAKDVQIFYSDSAVVRVKITSPVMQNNLDKRQLKTEFPNGVYVEFFDALKRPQTHLSANYATRDEQTNKIIMQDSVVVWTQKNEKLQTEELIWDEINERVYSDKFISVSTDKEVIYGVGFEANQEFTKWKILDVQGELEVNESVSSQE